MEISETINEGVVEPSVKKLLEKMITMLFTAVKRGNYPPLQKTTLIWIVAIESVSKGMKIIKGTDRK